MKRFFVITISLLYGLGVFADGKYKIKVKIDGASDSLCILAVYYGDKQYIKDTGFVDNTGFYTFEGNSDDLDRGMYIVAGQKKNTYFEFLLSEDKNFVLETDTLDPKGNLKASGCEENELFLSYLKVLDAKQKEAKPILDKIKASEDEKEKKKWGQKLNGISEDVLKYQKEIIANNENTFTANFIKATLSIDVPEAPAGIDSKDARKFKYNYYKDHYWDNVDLLDDGLIRTPFFHNKLKEYFEKVLLQLPDTIIHYGDKLIEASNGNKEMFKYLVWYITRMTETSKIMGMDKAFVYMAEEYYMSGKAHWATEDVLKKIGDRASTLKNLLIGAKAPNLTMVDTSYRRVSVYDTPADYLLVLFYDPDCGHCKKEMAKLKPFYNDYKSQGVEVFAIFSEADVEYWKKFVKDQNLRWINAINGYNVNYHDLYDIISTPVIYLLDKDKKILAKKLGAQQIIDFIKRDLGEDVPVKENGKSK